MVSATDRHKQIIDVSINIIAKNGIQKLTIKNISQSLGISEPAIYRYYDSKMDILLAILAHFKNNAKLAFEKINAVQESAIGQIELLFCSHFKQFTSNPALASVIFSEEIFQNDQCLSDEVSSIMQLNQNTISKIIESGQQKNEIRSDIPEKQLSLLIIGALRLIVTRWRLSNFSFDLEKDGTELFNSVKKIIKRSEGE